MSKNLKQTIYTQREKLTAIISRNKKRPSYTAIQVIRNDNGVRAGFLGADFDLRELPGIKETCQEPKNWRQIKGDPVIRSVVFNQQRAESPMDMQLDTILPIMRFDEFLEKCTAFWFGSKST